MGTIAANYKNCPCSLLLICSRDALYQSQLNLKKMNDTDEMIATTLTQQDIDELREILLTAAKLNPYTK